MRAMSRGSARRSTSPPQRSPSPARAAAEDVLSKRRRAPQRQRHGGGGARGFKAAADCVGQSVEAVTALRLGLILVLWFGASAMFNDATPRLMRTLKASGGTDVDVTALELAITVLIAATKLAVQGQRAFPPSSLMWPVLGVGTPHRLVCRLFIWGLQYIPVSIAQTIRAANPVVTVAFAVLVLREPLPSGRVLAALTTLLLGFALAVTDGSGGGIAAAGVAASVGSVCCLTLTNNFSKGLLSSTRENRRPVSSSELQCWICVAAIAILSPLTLAVVDTTRRLFIVMFTGFVLQGD